MEKQLEEEKGKGRVGKAKAMQQTKLINSLTTNNKINEDGVNS